MKKYVLVTGASSGIGEELSRIFAQNGYNLVLTARSEDKLYALKEKLESEYKIKALVMPKDLSENNAGDELFSQIRDLDINVDILVNNAGFGDSCVFLDSDLEKQKNMMELNMRSTMELCYLFGNDMRSRGSGRILNIASVAGFCAGPYMSVYYATKAFILSFSQGIREELLGTGVTVTVMCPGPTRTGFEKAADIKESPAFNASNVTASQVAKASYKALMKGSAVAYHGAITYALNIAVRLLPRSLSRKITKKSNGFPEK